MHSRGTNVGPKYSLTTSDAEPRFGSTKLASAIVRATMALAVLLALLLIAATPAQAQTETVLYNFTGGSDGGYPQGSLTSDAKGNLYGTTYSGGLWGYGTVFELSPNGNGGWNETVLYSFTGGADGAYPAYSDVIFDSAGNLFGTAYSGGANGYGVVFELSPEGANWTETSLYSFAGAADGANPVNGLIRDPSGNLYGKTFNGGAGDGVVFEISSLGSGWTEHAIYTPETEASDAGLASDAAGSIFGTTWSTVFELSPNGTGGWIPAVIHTFTGAPKDGIGAQGTPVLDQAGNLYGTTYNGGPNNYGTAYKLSPGKKGKWTERILHSGSPSYEPFAGIVFDADGNIYGTSGLGGGQYGLGLIYKLVPIVGKSSYSEKDLWSFSARDGAIPQGSLILDSAGNLYGTTTCGGSTFQTSGCSGYGVAFEVSPSAKPAPTTTTLTSSPNPSIYGQTVTFTAVVTSSAGAPPDGQTVGFTADNGEYGGDAALSNGSASFTTSTLPLGTKVFTAVYFGDWNLAPSRSKGVSQVVKAAK